MGGGGVTQFVLGCTYWASLFPAFTLSLEFLKCHYQLYVFFPGPSEYQKCMEMDFLMFIY